VAEAGFAMIGNVLGLGNDNAEVFLNRVRARRLRGTGLTEADIQTRIVERRTARENKDFARADAVRDELATLGIELMDGASATEWRIP
jgi:cysteinyl-tRNA synthetase